MELKLSISIAILISIGYLTIVCEKLLKEFREIKQEVSSIDNSQLEIIYVLKDILMQYKKTNDTSTVFSFEAYKEEYERKARGEE